MSKPKVDVLKRPFYTLAVTNGNKAEITLYGEIVTERPTDWWGDPIDGDFIILDEFLADLETVKTCNELTIRLNSIGGDAFAAFTIHNRLRDLKAKKTCIVDGVAMSGGSHIMCACDTVRVNPSSIVMIHDCITFTFGRLNSEQCTNLAKQLDVVDQAQAEIYARKTGKSVEELRAMMDETTYLTGRQAVEQGFADELIEDAEDPDIAVSADHKTIFAHGKPMRFAALGALPEGIKTVEPVPAKSPLPTQGAEAKDGGDNTPDASGTICEVNHMTWEEFRKENPEAAEAAIAEAQASVSHAEAEEAARTSERQRCEEIDSFRGVFDDATINAAKYGNPCTAQEMAFRAAQEMAKQGKSFLNQMQSDYKESGADCVGAAPATGEEDKPMTAEDRRAAGKAMSKKLSGEKSEEV